MLRSILQPALIAALAFAFWVAPAKAGDQDFTLHNNTKATMTSLYVSPHSSDKWGDDILGEDTLAPGDSVDVKFDRDEDECNWDVKGEFKDGSTAEVDDVDFCSVSEVNFHD
ncbi:MAG TPA: argininosuccinate lyase [Verrucomicrobiae bacterium]|nr:argininosuccinate lyase [Verrucomicrobiae bacterium]